MQGKELLIARLKKGQVWLTENYDAWFDGKLDDERWFAAFNAWDGLDRVLREVYDFKGCAVGKCDLRSPIACRGCVTPSVTQPTLL